MPVSRLISDLDHLITELGVDGSANLKLLAPDIALLTYQAQRHGEPTLHTLRSSIWEKRAGHWQIIFHQGTPGAGSA